MLRVFFKANTLRHSTMLVRPHFGASITLPNQFDIKSLYSTSASTANTNNARMVQPPVMDDYESKIYEMLQDHFEPDLLSVRDVSGGCGSMFAIQIESRKFKGIPMVKQHRLVNELLKDEISKWHGLQLKTKAIKD